MHHTIHLDISLSSRTCEIQIGEMHSKNWWTTSDDDALSNRQAELGYRTQHAATFGASSPLGARRWGKQART